jgi:hypothetical protein
MPRVAREWELLAFLQRDWHQLQEARTGWQALSMSRKARCILEAVRIRGKAQADRERMQKMPLIETDGSSPERICRRRLTLPIDFAT